MDTQYLKKTENIQIRINKPLKDKVEFLLQELGLTTSQAITLFFKQVVDKNGLPFNVSLSYDPIPLTQEEIEMINKSSKDKGKLIDTINNNELENYLRDLD